MVLYLFRSICIRKAFSVSCSSRLFLLCVCVCVSSKLTSSCCSCCGIGSLRIWLHVVEGEMNHVRFHSCKQFFLKGEVENVCVLFIG